MPDKAAPLDVLRKYAGFTQIYDGIGSLRDSGKPACTGDRAELRVAAIAGAVLGIVTGYSLGHGWFNMVIWAHIGAVVVSGAVYCYRALR